MRLSQLLTTTFLMTCLAMPLTAQESKTTSNSIVTSLDKSADPCVDFYQFACGGWIRSNPIPPDESRWSVYGKLAQDNQRFLWGILDGLAKSTAGRSLTQQKIGDYFAACMDEAAVEKFG